jgi:hypothetical protein
MTYFYEEYPLWNKFRSHTPRGFYDPFKGHTGTDTGTPIGTELSIPTETTVAKTSVQNEMGKTIYLTDKDGNILVFSHLSEFLMGQGDRVPSNTVFALSGNSGSATTGAHVHFEVISQTPQEGAEMMTRSLNGFSGYNIDPVIYLESLSEYTTPGLSYLYEHQFITTLGHRAADNFTKEETGLMTKRELKKSEEWILAKVAVMIEEALKKS